MKRLRATAPMLAILLTAVALVAGCGGGSEKDHNAQDVSFAKDMVPHHQQAVTMSDMALSQSSNPQVHDLATRIKAAQTSEISIMQGWLAAWGEEPTDHGGHGAGEAKDMESMKGMVSDADMAALQGTSGDEFDRLFLRHMTAHHQGALEMAKAQLAKGKFLPAKELAREITASQENEITEMARLLAAPRTASP